ncbi:MAG: ISNCY family transposase [Dehalococcoidales bacterium]|nr:ISNCY family transposase [Dehalococcoidales bacterium]
MTRNSIKEYAEAVKERYKKATKPEKGRILDEFTQATGLHRKAAIRLLNRRNTKAKKRCGRPRRYDVRIVEALKMVWEASDRLCSKRLHPFLPEFIKVLRRCGESKMTAEIEAELCRMSPATIDRLLHPWKQKGGRHSFSTTRPGSLLRSAIPIRTFTDWQENRPGFVEVDLVAHCGESLDGFYLNTLMAVDVATGWSEFIGVWGKGQQRVRAAIYQMREKLPFPLLGLDSDNGSEFINHDLACWCHQEGITFTRSRPYKKNDNCYVEQKNGNIVRRVIGRDRYSSKPAYETLNRVYYLLRLYMNFFQPAMKLVSKTRHGAKAYRIYDTAQTPYLRVLKSEVISEASKTQINSTYAHLNPVSLLKQINENVEHLWQLRDRHPGEKNMSKEDLR